MGPEGGPAVLYVDYGEDRLDWENLPGDYDGRFSLVLARSPDRGVTFEPGRVVDADVVPPGRFVVYQPVVPGFAIDRNGDPVVTWSTAATATPTSSCAGRPAKATSSTRRSG